MENLIVNKKASFDYFFKEKYEAGISLTGSEVKSLRAGSVSLADSYVKIINSRPILINAYIAPYKLALDLSYDPRRNRELLLHKEEIERLAGQLVSKNLTIVPVKVYTTHNLVKVEIALALPKKKSDKRDQLKREAIQRDVERTLREEKTAHRKE